MRRGGETFLLSNNHVIADEGEYPIGGDLFSPFADPTSSPKVAALDSLEPLASLGTVDGALAKLDSGITFSNEIPGVGKITGTATPHVGLPVKKRGAKTGVRSGVIALEDAAISFRYTHRSILILREQLVINSTTGEPFAADGDSGSVVVVLIGTTPFAGFFSFGDREFVHAIIIPQIWFLGKVAWGVPFSGQGFDGFHQKNPSNTLCRKLAPPADRL